MALNRPSQSASRLTDVEMTYVALTLIASIGEPKPGRAVQA